MSTDGRGTKWRKSITENFNLLSRVHKHYRRQTDRHSDGPVTAYSRQRCISCTVVCDSKEQYTPMFWLILALNLTVNHESNGPA